MSWFEFLESLLLSGGGPKKEDGKYLKYVLALVGMLAVTNAVYYSIYS